MISLQGNDPLLKKVFSRKTFRFAGWLMVIASTLAVFAPVLCNEKPLYARYHGENLFPALSLKGYADISDLKTGKTERINYATADWKKIELENVVWCPVAFSPGRSDEKNSGYSSPLADRPSGQRHWLGTTKTGADVLSGIIHGTRVSLAVGIFSMMIAGLIGIALGALAGFFGDYKIRVSKTGLISAVALGIPLAYFYGITLNKPAFSSAFSNSIWHVISLVLFVMMVIAVIIFLVYKAGKLLGRLAATETKVFFHLDHHIMRMIEVFNSIPRIVIIVTFSALAHPSVLNLILIIGLSSWTEIARLVRAEMLRVRESEYVQSAVVSGINSFRIIFRHALPNVLAPALTAITLGVASAILVESALSFLGIGVPGDVVTWGSLLNEGQQNFSAWWLVLFPGLAIFITVSAINILGDALNESLEAK